MAQAALAHELLLPRPPGGMLRGAALALAAHGALLFALTVAVQWRASPPETVSAELWAAVPQVAAPRPVEPPPAPKVEPKPEPRPEPKPEPKAEPTPDPQIVIAREKERLRREQEADTKKREAEAKKRELAEAQKRKAQEERERQAEEQRLAKLREENLKRLMGQVGATGNPNASGTAAQDAAPSRGYAGRLVAAIKPNIVFTDIITGNPAAEVEVRAAPSGTIIGRRLVRSSGNKDWDDAVLRAIDRTGTLPRDVDGRVPPTIVVAFRPQE